jgi:thiosulfate/3-mercaptopyruvate sulfurtransferase
VFVMSRNFVSALCLAVGLLWAFAGSVLAAEPLVSAEWLGTQLGNPRVVVVDLRPAAAFVAGHIPGALSSDFATTGWTVPGPGGAAGALPEVDRIAETIGTLGVGDADQAVIVADAFPAAARVYWTFKVLGHAEVSILDGGWRGWTGPVASGPTTRRPTVFTPRYTASLRADLTEVATAIAEGGATLVDARPLSQWNGTVKSPLVSAGGHLPGAVSLDQGAALTADGRLKSRNTLALLFALGGNKPAIVYCNAGYLSATDWFVLSEVLHRPGTKLYDGSMSEWTTDPSRPVVK